MLLIDGSSKGRERNTHPSVKIDLVLKAFFLREFVRIEGASIEPLVFLCGNQTRPACAASIVDDGITGLAQALDGLSIQL